MKIIKRALSVLLATVMCIPSGIVNISLAQEQDNDRDSYSVVIGDAEHGEISFKDTDEKSVTRHEGETVELELLPEAGYEVESFVLKEQSTDKVVASKKTSDSAFSFSMPAMDLTVTAEFAEMEDIVAGNKEDGEDAKKEEKEGNAQYEITDDIPLMDDEIDAELEKLNNGENKDKDAVDSTKTTAYISKNLDEQTVDETAEIAEVEAEDANPVEMQSDYDKAGFGATNHSINVNYHLVDTAGKKLAQNGFDSKDFISSSAQKQTIYSVEGNEDCFVSFIDLGKMNGVGKGVTASFSNSDADNFVDYNDIITYDEKTGIAYIPKSLFFNEKGEEIVLDLQAQVFVPYSLDGENKNVISVSVENSNKSVKEAAQTQNISVPSFDVTVTFPLLTKETAKGFDMSKTKIYINDATEPTVFADDEYFFDEETGELTIAVMPMTVYSIKAVIEGKTVASRIADTFAGKSNADVVRQVRYPSDIKMIPDVYLNVNYDDLTVNHLETKSSTVTYKTNSAMPQADKDIVRKYYEYLCYSGNNYTNSLWAAQAIYNGAPLESFLQEDFGDAIGGGYSESTIELYNYLFTMPGLTQSSTGVNNQKLPLHSVMLFQGAGAEGGTGSTVAADLALRDLKQEVNIRVLGKNRVNGIEYGIFGFSVYNTTGTVAAYGIYKIPVRTPVGYIQIQKESANSDVTDGNTAYTFEGAKFQIMQGNTVITDEVTGEDTFTLDKTGKSDVIAVPLVNGNNTIRYTVREISAPTGYKINNQSFLVDVGLNSTATSPAIVRVVEEPYTYPSDIVINKFDRVSDYSVGDASLAGIQYEVLYYEGYDMDDFTSVSGLTPTRKWTIETKMRQDYANKHDGTGHLSGGSMALYGHAELKDEYLVRGKSDALYKDSSNNVVMPLGTYIVREVDAGAGYTSLGEMYVMQDGVKEPNYSANKQGTDDPTKGLLFMVKANIPETKDYRDDTNQNGGLKVPQYATYKTTGYVGTTPSNKRITNIIYSDSTITATNKVKYGGLDIQKLDYNDKTKNPQGDASDMSSKYGVKNLSSHPVVIKSEHNIQICSWNASDSWTDDDGITWYVFEPVDDNSDKYMFTFNTNYYGAWRSSDNLLPYGTYRVDEITAPTGYQRNGVVVKKFTIRDEGEVVSVNIEDMIKRGTIFLVKFDAEDHTSTNQGSGQLQGTYTIKNKSKHYVWVLDNGIDDINIIRENADKDAGAVEVTGEGTWYKFAPETDMFTFTTKKIGNFEAAWTTSNPYLLSYGTYEIRETGTTDSYIISDIRKGNNKAIFSITENGQIVEFGTDENGNNIIDPDAILTNPVARGGFKVQKSDADRKEHKVNNSPSSLTPQGDSSFDGAVYKVTTKNQNYVWVKEAEGIKILTENATSSKEIDGVKWYKFLNGKDMFTFETDADGNFESVDDLLSYGTYRITEVTASEGYLATEKRGSIVAIDITISADGQKVDKTYAEDAKDNQFNDSLYEAVIRGGVKIQKNDANVKAHNFVEEKEGEDGETETIETPSSTIAQGDATLEGAVYDIYNISRNYVWVDTDNNGTYEDSEYYAPSDIDVSNEKELTFDDVKDLTPVYSITTDENGFAQTGNAVLPYGTYLVVERTPSEGYLNGTMRGGIVAHTFEIREEGKIVDKLTYNKAKEDGNLENSFYEPIIRGGFNFHKNDEETGTNTPLGGADLKGKFSVTNVSNSYVWIKDEEGITLNLNAEDHFYDEETGYHLYGKNEVMFTFETGKDDGSFETSDSLLPYGTYKITETVPPNGYLVESNRNDNFETTIEIREEGKVVDATQLVYNYVMRGDVFFEKKDATSGLKMTYIPFLITAFDKDGQAIESHVVYTDKNGSFGSSEDYTLHTYKTNKADETVPDIARLQELTLAEDKEGIENLMKEGNYYSANSIKEFFENENYGMGLGVWFGVGTEPINGKRTDRLEKTGALPFGRYRIDELPCEANEGKALVHDTFTITNESCKTTPENNPLRYHLGVQAAGNINFGTIYNWEQELAPQMTTSARVRSSNTQYSGTDSAMVITDTVHYQGIEKGKEYTLVAKVADAQTGDFLTDAVGNIAETTKKFTPNTKEGYEQMEICVDTRGYEGRTIVVYETMYDEFGDIYINHTDPQDKEQQIHFPNVRTNVLVAETQSQLSLAKDSVTVVDTLNYENLSKDATYTLKSYLIDATTGAVITDISGNRVEHEESFRPASSNGTLSVTFNFDASEMAGKSIVVCEEILENGHVISSHADKDDKKQTVWFPGAETEIHDVATGLQMSSAGRVANIVDEVSYSAVKPNTTYTVVGNLVDRESGRAVATKSVEFTPSNESGTVRIPYVADTTELEGKTLVSCVSIKYGNHVVGEHNDMEDEKQTIYVPKVRTSASDKENGFKISKADKDVTIVDTVSYENVMAGKTYRITGNLVDAETGRTLEDAKGANIVAETEFVAEGADGQAEVTFSFDGSELAGKTAVAYETIEVLGETNTASVVGSHRDIDDAEQTVRFPYIESTATNVANEDHIAKPGKVSIKDTFVYRNLVPGVEYTLVGKVFVKETKEILATSEFSFTPEESDGLEEIIFKVDAGKYAGKTLIVSDELKYEGHTVAESNSITNENTMIHVTSVKTVAVDGENGTHVSYADDSITIVDTVNYSNLIPGKQYVMFGSVVDQETGEVLSSYIIDEEAYYEQGDMHEKWTCEECGEEFGVREDVIAHMDASDSCENYSYELYYDKIYHEEVGHYGTVTAVKPFLATSANGTVTMTFNFDGTGFEDRTLVVYEEIFMENEDGIVLTENYDCVQCGAHYGTKAEVEEHFRQSQSGCNTYSFYYTTDMFDVGEHKDKYDDKQTIHIPELTHTGTNDKEENKEEDKEEAGNGMADVAKALGIMNVSYAATDASIPNGNHYLEAGKECTVTDTVTYKNLVPGLSYKIVGTLVDKETGQPTNITATYTFVPTQPYNDVELVFEFDTTEYVGRTLVATEVAYINETDIIATYNDLNDAGKAVYIVKVDTDIKDDNTDDNTTSLGKTTITDTVTVEGLKPGDTYIGIGKLMDPETGEEYKGVDIEIDTDDGDDIVVDGDNEGIVTPDEATKEEGETEDETEEEKGFVERIIDSIREFFHPTTSNSIEFTATSTKEVFKITYEIETSALQGKSLVSVVEVREKETGNIVGDHNDLEDEDQTINVASLDSDKIIDAYTGMKQAMFGKTAIADNISYGNLSVGKTYTAKATAKDAKTGETLATVEEEFEALKKDGEMQLTFYIDSSKVQGRKISFTEELYMNGVKVALHKSDAEEDLVYVASITSSAINEDTKTQSTPVGEKVKITDTVNYTNLVAGETYKITGTLVDTETNENIPLFTEGEEEAFESSIEFVAEESDGTVEVPFEVSTKDLSGKSLVGYETITFNDVVVAEHKNPEDESQTVYIPTIKSEVADKETKDKVVSETQTAIIVDTINVGNLVNGKEYTIKSQLMDSETGDIVVTASSTFVAESRNAKTELELKFDATAYAGKTLVSQKALVLNDVELLKGTDENIYVAKINAGIESKDTDIQMLKYGEDAKATATVAYQNVSPSKEYVAHYELVDAETGNIMGESEVTSLFEGEAGEITAEFDVDTTALEGRKLGVNAKLYMNGICVASHAYAEGDTNVGIAGLASDLYINGEKDAPELGETVKITDKAGYLNVTPGKEYTLTGKVIDVETGNTVKFADGTESKEVKFVAESEEGVAEVEFELATKEVLGKKLAVIETLKYNDAVLAVSDGTKGEGQFVTITDNSVNNGDNDNNNNNNGGTDNKDDNKDDKDKDTDKDADKDKDKDDNKKPNKDKTPGNATDTKKPTASSSATNDGKKDTNTNNAGNNSTSNRNNITNNRKDTSSTGSTTRRESSNSSSETEKGDVRTGDSYMAIIIILAFAVLVGVSGLIFFKKKK